MSRFDLAEGGQLIGRLLIGKGGLELPLPFGVGGKGEAGLRLRAWPAARPCRRPGRGRPPATRLLLLAPGRAAELRQFRIALAAADVLLHQVDLRSRHVEEDAVAEFEHQMLFLDCGMRHADCGIGRDLTIWRFVFPCRARSSIFMPRKRAMPWTTWTTRSPSLSSRN